MKNSLAINYRLQWMDVQYSQCFIKPRKHGVKGGGSIFPHFFRVGVKRCCFTPTFSCINQIVLFSLLALLRPWVHSDMHCIKQNWLAVGTLPKTPTRGFYRQTPSVLRRSRFAACGGRTLCGEEKGGDKKGAWTHYQKPSAVYVLYKTATCFSEVETLAPLSVTGLVV